MRRLSDAEGTARLASTLGEVAAQLPYLRATLDPPSPAVLERDPADGDWLACDVLVTTDGWLRQVILATGRQLNAPSPAVAASLFVLGYAYRVLALAVASVTVGGVVPPSDASSMAIGLARGRPSLVGYRSAAALDLEPGAGDIERRFAESAICHKALAAILDEAVEGHLRLLVQATSAQVRVGRRLLWGNVAASAAVAFRTMEGLLGPWLRPLGEAFFEAAPSELHGQGSFLLVEADGRHGWFWERTNCCLNDQLPSRIRCGDCSRTPAEERQAAYRRAVLGSP